MEPDVLISGKNLTRVYGKNKLAVKVLDVKSLEIRRGEFIALTGPSGCGKTTLLNLLGVLDRPSGGDIIFEGKKISERDEAFLCRFRRQRIGFIFQAYHLIPTISALKNVMVPAFPLGSGRYKRRAMELIRQVGLAGKEGRRPDDLSGGEQQRVAIARALLLDPDLILADEPTGNLDSATGAEIMDLLKTLNQKGKTVLVATHDQRVAEGCGRNIRMMDGQII
ncbi:ABC transporter ATP-binding protein [Desulfoscipio gibsoniae]|uniref:ABC-type antimicrobial peptide transport system, ATPase component n=1 Tax=Desulfoscipio gibsoniae DSM 7213 TaxID=767817 RepID=R4KEP0_9FIRM|nr:ABC transporter ATP-binding protein [Desulfoscipio gibsoniae]AGL01044.1 ABC-type antimicrobial peptide transport system, ATPase component [Desulfoscipio gibsoniae DSM 7213]